MIIAHLSDLHFGAQPPQAVDSVLADVVAAAPTLTVVTGDLTMRARRSQFQQARAMLDRLPTPLMVLMGNHDIALDRPDRIWSPYARYRQRIESDLDPVLELPGLKALGMHSMPRWRWKGGRISGKQAARVGDVLSQAPLPAVRLLALHHPISPRGFGRIAGRNRLIRACVQAQVDLVLAGHTHRPAVRPLAPTIGNAPWPVLEVVAGTATSTRERGSGRSWNLIRVDPEAIEIHERRQVGSQWQTGHVVVYPRGVHWIDGRTNRHG